MAEIKTIKLAQALKEMSYGEPFNVSFYTADKKRKTGGAIVELENVTLTWDANNKPGPESKEKGSSAINAPAHYRHATRNFVLPNNKIRKTHIWLLREFNNKRIVL
jgi:hypothetical protein